MYSVWISKQISVGPSLMRETSIYYLYRVLVINNLRSKCTFVSRKCHNFVAYNDYNLSFVTCNHCHNVSLNYVQSQILIGEKESQKCGSQIKFTHYVVHIAIILHSYREKPFPMVRRSYQRKFAYLLIFSMHLKLIIY